MTLSPQVLSSPTSPDLDRLNQQFAQAHPKSILLWCLEHLSEGMVQTTAFGLSGMVIMDLLYRDLNPTPAVPVVFLDTLHHFSETLDLVSQAESRYQFDLRVYRPELAQDREAFAHHYGDRLWDTDVSQFHTVTKVEPLARAFKELEIRSWITGRRRDQSSTRSQLPIFEKDASDRIKVNPLASWTNKDVWKYIMENDVPYNVLHNYGYGSIGDEPLTTPITADEHERDGRWRGSGKTECGIHL